MRSASVLRQLGRRAKFAPALSTPRRSGTAASCSGLSLREPRRCAGARGAVSNAQSKPFTTSPKLSAPWKLTPPTPPSVHPHAHRESTPPPFAGLAASEQFRSVMRLLPNSVVVCTSACGSGGGGNSAPSSPSLPRGMTMSSLTSLSLHPTPLLTFNIATPSRTLDAVAATRAFNIHVLRGDAEGVRVAEWFRRGNADARGVFDAARMREGCGCEAGLQAEGAAPLLRGRGVLYGMRCRLLDDAPHRGLVTVRDHVVVLAEVVDIVERRGEEEEEGDGEEVFGLAYADRRYRQLGRTMVYED